MVITVSTVLGNGGGQSEDVTWYTDSRRLMKGCSVKSDAKKAEAICVIVVIVSWLLLRPIAEVVLSRWSNTASAIVATFLGLGAYFVLSHTKS